MSHGTSAALMFLLAIALLTICAQSSEARVTVENGVKSKVYLSPVITQRPGSVSNKMYYDIEFPKGHIAIKSFDAEVVDESGNPVSLQETYLHHWIAVRYYLRKGTKEAKYNSNIGFHQSDLIVAGNAGVCKYGLPQNFGLGSETRKTSTHVPDPYGIEVGNPSEVPVGYEERWAFNIHAIDTRGAVDAMGCTECRCNLYNVTEDEFGLPLKPNYVGGLYCCYDGAQCKVKNGLESVERNLYMKYTVKWVDWSDTIVPVKIFIFDVTDTWQKTGTHDCLIEFDVEQSTTGVDNNDWISTRRSSVSFPSSGDVVYGVAHQHSGGIGSALYGEDGRVICSSKPIYGQGNTAGDEAGYIVGMATCYPEPGSVKIAKGETLTLESNYSSEKSHTGVMGLFYILVAESSSTLNASVQFPKGHIAIKSFDAEVVDESGNPVSLQETYLHHWIAVRYYLRKGTKEAKYNSNIGFHQSDLIIAGNAGVCKYGLPQIFGLGSETRKTSTHVPDPYGIEVGNPSEVPVGYEERWAFNIHAIDTRGAVDAMGCTECRCNLYNVTEDEFGRPLKPNYVGGLYCCYDGAQCKVKNGLESVERNLYMKYTVKWVDWSDSIVPVKIFIFDVTDTWQKTGTHDCLIEFDVEQSTTGVDNNDWISTRRSTVSFPSSGDVVYGVAHQHSGGIGSALYGEDGRVICSSKPIYGQGKTAGDEAGYIVGMATCYPEPGSVKIAKGETLTLESNYSSEKSHTGVMGLFYILVAESSSTLNASVQFHQESNVPIILFGVAVFGLAMSAAVIISYQRRKQSSVHLEQKLGFERFGIGVKAEVRVKAVHLQQLRRGGPEGDVEHAVEAEIAREVLNKLIGDEEPHCFGAGVTKSQVKPEIISWSPRIIVFHNVLCIELKYLRSDQLVEYVSSGMVLGLGTCSPAAFVVYKIGQLLASGQLTNIIGVPTSKRTQEQAAALGITLSILGDHPKLDLAIDGANEVDPDLNLVKGTGGALLREKMVEAASNKCVVVVDDSKLVTGLGGLFKLCSFVGSKI
ncbi:Stress up-regulated Nod 19 [Artemisia annua]|uniref:ribose-5-phosphate isomerase n=1 Tax=Artemisia annua TaxID=35608 RepID=A0A2U1N7Q8_ARTAN|nr:Stress up-regulated Nod 19 [Artemisia annua]